MYSAVRRAKADSYASVTHPATRLQRLPRPGIDPAALIVVVKPQRRGIQRYLNIVDTVIESAARTVLTVVRHRNNATGTHFA